MAYKNTGMSTAMTPAIISRLNNASIGSFSLMTSVELAGKVVFDLSVRFATGATGATIGLFVKFEKTYGVRVTFNKVDMFDGITVYDGAG